MTDSASSPIDQRTARRRVNEDVGPKLRRKVLDDAEEVCAYCGTYTASEADHIRPVAQGGTRDPGNLAAACHRCNQEKSGKTPAAWKARRLQLGKSWPPPNCWAAFSDFVLQLPPDDLVRAAEAFRAGDSRVRAAIKGFVDRYYDETPREFEADRAELMEQVALFRAERDV